jgi:hypothetical protein
VIELDGDWNKSFPLGNLVDHALFFDTALQRFLICIDRVISVEQGRIELYLWKYNSKNMIFFYLF